MKTFSIFFIVLFCLNYFSHAQEGIRVGVYADFQLKTITIKPKEGTFVLYCDQKKLNELDANSILYVSPYMGYLKLRDKENHLGYFKEISLLSDSLKGEFELKPVFPQHEERVFKGNLHLKSVNQQTKIVAQVDMEEYLKGVVRSEAGLNHSLEYYKVQAIISRTYAYGHLNKHAEEGFHLCDGVHCQVYQHRTIHNEIIKKAVEETKALVITNKANKLITAAFHSNSGGQTANSEDVWIDSVSYLRSVFDKYSLNERNASWEQKISIHEFTGFLQKKGVKLDHAANFNFTFEQGERKKYLTYQSDSVLLRDVREFFRLRSTFFSIRKTGKDELTFYGRGYGHGVGLSQIGAMKMSKMGFSYKEIIDYYYSDVKIIPVTEIIYIKPD